MAARSEPARAPQHRRPLSGLLGSQCADLELRSGHTAAGRRVGSWEAEVLTLNYTPAALGWLKLLARGHAHRRAVAPHFA